MIKFLFLFLNINIYLREFLNNMKSYIFLVECKDDTLQRFLIDVTVLRDFILI